MFARLAKILRFGRWHDMRRLWHMSAGPTDWPWWHGCRCVSGWLARQFSDQRQIMDEEPSCPAVACFCAAAGAL